MLQTASLEEIKQGKVSDVYFERSRQVLSALGLDKNVTAEIVLKKFPAGYSWGVWAGLEESLEVLQGLKIDVTAMPEGTIFNIDQPLMVIEGRYLEFGIFETALLGFLCQASGIATKAARCRLAAGNKTVISFGARRMHPTIAPMIERNAYLGGCDGVAVMKSADLLGIQPSGTIPHALILIIGDTVKAVQAFHEIIDQKVNRVALIDTFQDEKFEALNVARALGKHLYGVRLDTPANRRGDFLSLLKEVRWELDLRGFQHVKVLVSGGIDENQILQLNEVVDAYGVGTSISNAPVLDFALDIVAIEGQPMAKRGKRSGKKEVYRCPQCQHTAIMPYGQPVVPACGCQQTYQPLLQPLIKNGHLMHDYPDIQTLRQYVLRQLQTGQYPI
ncbi:MAG: nicotinate phosphoribosyltransferase [candidate division KSB1 bacterium]|nr:nicotinate phosphoribosyltransferase [candidate division KSB1 bacterium]